MIVDEGMAKRNGEHLAVQYLKQVMKNCPTEYVNGTGYYHYHKYIELFYLEEGEVNAISEIRSIRFSRARSPSSFRVSRILFAQRRTGTG